MSDYYVENVNVDKCFSFVGVTYNDLAKVVFSRRREFLSYVGVAEYFLATTDYPSKDGRAYISRLHFISGLESKRWFADLIDTLGQCENFSVR
jgi:hypothetical protein